MSSSSSNSSPTKAASFSLVVAADENNGIGVNGDLPWRLPGDMKFFRELTTGEGNNTVIMGRKTWQSIPDRFRPLPGRVNVVLSRSELELPDGVHLAPSLEDALHFAQVASNASENHGSIYVIGGSQVYGQALLRPECCKIYLTRIQSTFDCHAFLPDLQLNWKIGHSGEPKLENGLTYQFLTLVPIN